MFSPLQERAGLLTRSLRQVLLQGEPFGSESAAQVSLEFLVRNRQSALADSQALPCSCNLRFCFSSYSECVGLFLDPVLLVLILLLR
jgi:hypothetical protein